MSRSWIILLLLISALKSWGQDLPYNSLFFWNKDRIIENHVNSIHSYSFPYSKDSMLVDEIISKGIWQTKENFDSLGRIVEKIQYNKFSDRGDLSQKITYNKKGKVEAFNHYENGKLSRAEAYKWENGLLEEWRISVPEEERTSNYKKELIYGSLGREIKVRIKKGVKTLSEDTVIWVKRDKFLSRIVRNKKARLTKDSIVYHLTSEDTLLKKEVFIQGIISFTEYKYKLSDRVQIKSVEYVDGEFNYSYYRTYHEGLVIREKQIHQIPNLNYTKTYFYDDNGLPVKKEIYRNTKEPVSVIYYVINN